jgi:hypothetical protein
VVRRFVIGNLEFKDCEKHYESSLNTARIEKTCNIIITLNQIAQFTAGASVPFVELQLQTEIYSNLGLESP